jgi:hypothetical protein
MVKIILFKRSILFVLLISNSANPLLAVEPVTYTLENKKETPSVSREIKNLLVAKGLSEEQATHKANKFLNTKNLFKVSHLYSNPNLGLSKEDVYNALTKYALYEKHLNLNSYDSLIGFVQRISLQPLDKQQLKYLSDLALLS